MFRSIAIAFALCLATVPAQAALLGRAALTPGGTDYQAYYDDVLNITWMADANLAASNSFGVIGIGYSGAMAFSKANEWIAAMNTAAYLGTSDWRLPTIRPVNGSTFNYSISMNGSTDRGYNLSEQDTPYAGSTASELAYMFYNNLNKMSLCNPVGATAERCGIQRSRTAGVANTVSNYYPHSFYASQLGEPLPIADYGSRVFLSFEFDEGEQLLHGDGGGYAWAVRDGDMLAPVPVPASVYLFGSALGLMGVMRRRITEEQ
jgi:hypothetical protein